MNLNQNGPLLLCHHFSFGFCLLVICDVSRIYGLATSPIKILCHDVLKDLSCNGELNELILEIQREDLTLLANGCI